MASHVAVRMANGPLKMAITDEGGEYESTLFKFSGESDEKHKTDFHRENLGHLSEDAR